MSTLYPSPFFPFSPPSPSLFPSLSASLTPLSPPPLSFFHLFDPKKAHLAFVGDGSVQLSHSDWLEREAEVALAFRDSVIPRAFELYETARECGVGEEDDDEEEEEEEDDEVRWLCLGLCLGSESN